MCAAFVKESRMKVADPTELRQEIRGSALQGSAVFFLFLGGDPCGACLGTRYEPALGATVACQSGTPEPGNTLQYAEHTSAVGGKAWAA